MDFSLLHNPDVIAALKEGFIFTLTVTVLAMMGGYPHWNSFGNDAFIQQRPCK